jgi:hypothetical protein
MAAHTKMEYVMPSLSSNCTATEEQFECHAITNKYSEAVSVVQQICTVLCDIKNLAGCALAKAGESSECTSVVNSMEENRANFCKVPDGKPLFSAFYGMYAVMPNELKAILKVSAQEGRSGAVNKTSVKSMAQDDDLHEVMRRKRYISNNTLQTARKSTKPVPTSAAMLTHNFFAPLRTTDMDTETTEAENTLPEQEASRKPGRPLPVVMTFITNLVRLQSDLKTMSKESKSSEIDNMEPISQEKKWWTIPP